MTGYFTGPCAALVLGAACLPAAAAPIGYTDEALFNAALASLGTVTPVVQDFEALTYGDLLPNGTVLDGITYSLSSDPGFELAVNDIGGSSGFNTLGVSDDGGADVDELGFFDVVSFDFAAANAFSLKIISSDDFEFFSTDAMLNFAGGSVFNTPGIGDPTGCTLCGFKFLGIIDTDATATSATLTFNADGSGIGELDDVAFYTVSTAAVPLPAAAWLMFGAFGGLAGLRSLRRKV